MEKEKIDFIGEAFKKEGICDSYPKTLATLTRNKIKLKTTGTVGDLILLVTKKGFENVASHVGRVKEVNEKDVSFELNFSGEVKTITLPLTAFLNKTGFAIVGFYTVK